MPFVTLVDAQLKRPSAADGDGGAGATREERLDQNGLAGEAPGIRYADELVANRQRKPGPRVGVLRDVKVGATQAGVPGAHDDLPLAGDGLGNITPGEASGLDEDQRAAPRLTRAPPPRTRRSTAASVAIDVSPGWSSREQRTAARKESLSKYPHSEFSGTLAPPVRERGPFGRSPADYDALSAPIAKQLLPPN